jgi:hypothetical protein
MAKKHVLVMIGCCLVAIAAVVAGFIFNVPLNRVFVILLIALCPLSHLLMMGMMGHGGHDHNQPSEKPAISAPRELRND